MNRNILWKVLIPVPVLALVVLLVLIFAPSESPDAAVAGKYIKVTPIVDDQVISPKTAIALDCKMPEGCNTMSVTWSSSNPICASVSQSGVLRTRRRGKTSIKIRVRYTRNRIKKVAEKTISIRIGTPVKTLTLKGDKDTIGRGDHFKLKCKITPGNATDKGIIWSSSNPSVATVSEDGTVYGEHRGEAVITAMAADGSGICCGRKINVFSVSKDDTCFIAHRGLCTEAPENTVSAFDAAGKAGFWGAECDIRESAPDEEGKTDLIVSHDSSYLKMTGDDRKVSEVTASEAVSLKITHGKNHEELDEHICTLSDFLRSCAAYRMVPIIELKDPDMSKAAYKRLFWALDAAGLAESAIFISFKESALDSLKAAYESCKVPLGLMDDAYPTCWLLSDVEGDGVDIAAYALTAGYDGIILEPESINDDVYSLCKRSGLGLAACTFHASDYNQLHQIIEKYHIQMATTDGRMFE